MDGWLNKGFQEKSKEYVIWDLQFFKFLLAQILTI